MTLSSCHYVVELNGQYSGDMLEMKMFLFFESKLSNAEDTRFIEMDVKIKYKSKNWYIDQGFDVYKPKDLTFWKLTASPNKY